MKTKLNGELYSKAGIEEAKKAFGHLAGIEVAEAGGDFLVSFGPAAGPAQEALEDEFLNYALYATLAGKKS